MSGSQTIGAQGALELACTRCVRNVNALKAALIDLENAEMSLRAERRKTKALRQELEERQHKHARRDEVEQVFEHWRKATGHPRAKLGAKRAESIAKQLDADYTVQDLKYACDGAALLAFTGANGVKHDDLELICRDEIRLETWRDAGEAAGRKVAVTQRTLTFATQGVTAALKHRPPMPPIWDELMRCTRSKCPVCKAGDSDVLYRPLMVFIDRVVCQHCDADLPAVTEALKKEGLLC